MVNTLKRLLAPRQLSILDAPKSPSRQHDVSPLVQNLESVAVTDPAYRNGQTRNAQGNPSASRSQTMSVSSASPGPGSPRMGNTRAHSSISEEPSKSPKPPKGFAPLAYNPAAPAAPEPIAHREDTPPPPDAESGTGLLGAQTDTHQGYGGHYQQTYTGLPVGTHYGSPPPPAQPWGVPPAHGVQPINQVPAQSSFSSPPTSSAAPKSSSASTNRAEMPGSPPAPQSFAAPPVDQNHLQQQQHLQAQPVLSPGTQILGTGYGAQPHHVVGHIQPQYQDYLSSRPPPAGGYSNYDYQQQQQQHGLHRQSTSNSQYDVHHQFYRPTETEHHKPHRASTSSSNATGKGSYTDRVDKGINKLFGKLEKKLG